MGQCTVAVVSGYFSPLHVGHLRLIRDAKQLGDILVVIVNNDEQQVLKKGKLIIPEQDRLEIIDSIKFVDRTVLSIDVDASVRTTLASLRKEYPAETLVFANGGDRRDTDSIAEAEVCQDLSIEIKFGVGGHDKVDASSRIIEALDV